MNLALSLFGKSRSTDDQNGDGENGTVFKIEPEKARKWFDQAKLTADTRNYEYAINSYLNGLKFDPGNMDAHQSLFEVAGLYKSIGGKTATGKEVREIGTGKQIVDKFVAAELAWVKDALNPSLALKFTKIATDMGLNEVAYWAGEMGVRAVLRGKKPTKNAIINFVDIFERINAADKAVQYGQIAMQLDPTDAQLEARVRNLSAQAAMNKGGYEENAGEEGGYRKSIKDLDKQVELTENESLAIGSDAKQRRLKRAQSEWEEDPLNQNNVAKYADLLHKEGDDEHDKEAIRVLLDGFKRTKQYRFRMLAGDVKLSMERRKLRAMREKAEASGLEEDLNRVRLMEQKLREAELTEFAERVEKYPTDLRLKYEYGKRLFELERYDEAIPVFQDAMDDARNKAHTAHYVGLCFLKQDWFEEAVESLRNAVEMHEIKDDDTHLGMRYDLMEALTKHAEESEDLDSAEQAFTIARGITMKKLNFRDIKNYRDHLRDVVKKLKSK